MIGDLRQLGAGPPIEADLCIVGAGAAGITLAHELLGSRLKLCLVESGGLDFATDTQGLYAGESIGLTHYGMEIGRLRFFGGTTNHWGGRCTKLSALDFAVRPWVPHSGWPIGRTELDPYYDRARALCRLGPKRPPRAILSELGVTLPTFPAPDLRPKIWEHVPPPLSFAAVFGDELRRAEAVQILLHANLVAILANPSASAVHGIEVASLDGSRRRIVARAYVLCCGAIENARLLLASGEDGGPGLGNRHDLVGRFYMDHFRGEVAQLVTDEPLPAVEDLFNYFTAPDERLYQIGMELTPEAQQQRQLLNGCAVLDYRGDPNSGVTEAQAIWRELQQGRWASDLGEKVWRVLRDIDAVVGSVRRRVGGGRHPLLPLGAGLVTVDLEQAPNPESRVTLSDRRNALGQREARLDWRATALERRTAARFAEMIGIALTRMGLGRCRIDPWLAGSGERHELALGETFHQAGTTRMAADPRDGVVDADCRVHGVENLYVAGGSVFPSCGHANPTLTIVALALRLADHLRSGLSFLARGPR